MRTDSHGFRLVAAAAAAGFVLGPLPLGPARAQPAQPDRQSTDQQPVDRQTADPPARIGRVARISGTVSFHAQQATQWSPATRNYPVTAGDAFWTEPRAEADIEFGASRIAMAGGTELDIGALDGATVQASEPQGEVYLHLRSLAQGESYVLQTPRATVTIGAPGRYAIAAGDTESPTLVTVLEGAAQVSGPGVALDAGPDQTVTITGSDTIQAVIGPARHDVFMDASMARERPSAHPSIAPPPVVARMPGGEDLYASGTWEPAPEYGPVWYPQVAADWAPYRDGHWAYVAPWGWTWIDDAPWGFAPFHYGRWVDIDGRWAWTPAPEAVPEQAAYPVYAPALVTFFGVGAVALGATFAAGSIGWVPLGPREAYHPWYHASPTYVRQFNSSVAGRNEINRPVALNSYVNRGAATVVPAGAVVGSQPIGRVARHVNPTILAAARPMMGTNPIRPTTATSGVTPAVARQFNLPPGTTRPAAPGPAIPAQATGAFVAPHRPPLANPGRTEGTPSPVIAAPLVPHPGLPALRRPGEIQAGPPPIAHAPVLPTTAEPGREAARPEPVPSGSRPAGSTEPAVLSRPGALPPSAGFATEPHPGVASQPHPGPSLPAEPQRPVVHAPIVPAVPQQPITAAQHPSPTGITAVAPPVHVAAPMRPELHTYPAFQPRTSPPPEAHFPAAPPPQVHLAPPPVHVAPTPEARALVPPPQVHLAPPPVHVAPPPEARALVPPPPVHVAPPPEARAFVPPPQFHIAPPPPVHVAAPAPQPHFAQPQPEHSAPAQAQKSEKRPGER